MSAAAERLLTPSKITAWLECGHFLTLRHEVESGLRPAPSSPFGEMARMLLDKGLEHEQAVLRRYRDGGRDVVEVDQRADRETFAVWAARVAPLLDEGHDVLFQMPLAHDGVRGIADFLIRADLPGGGFTYEPLDAKLARNEAKPGHVLQLCFYAEAIEAWCGHRPEYLHLALGSGVTDRIRSDDVLAYWRRLRTRLARLLADERAGETTPEPCDHCKFCEFELVCEAQWRAADSLVHVAGMPRAERAKLEAGGVSTIAELAELDGVVADLDPLRQQRLTRQAALQVRARQEPDLPPPFELLARPVPAQLDTSAPPEPVGFAALPEPDVGDVFLDFEGHPFWRADAELFFLFGLIERGDDAKWSFRAWWAHDEIGEQAATQALIDHLAARRARHPGMHVYHYNHTERSSLERLTTRYAVAELPLEQLIRTGAFVDLLPVVKGALQIGVESYSLKQVERVTTFERGHEIDRGAGAVVEYERWMGDGDTARLTRIAAYNEDDVRALRAVRDWLVAQRPADVDWRAAVLDAYQPSPELDERIVRLHAFGPGTVEHLMGDLLGYWRRERSVVSGDAYRLSVADHAEQLESPAAIAGIVYVGDEPRYGKNGRELKHPAKVFTYPAQPIDADITPRSKLIVALNEQQWAFFQFESIDRERREFRVVWNAERAERGLHPTSLAHWPWFNEAPKPEALCLLADELLADGGSRVGHAILQRDPPHFVAGGGPTDGRFTADVADICAWAPQLDDSFVAVQGPPGTGKTFAGAHIVRTLVNLGRRVGITAMSHAAIENLLSAFVKRFDEDGDRAALHAVRKARHGGVDGVDYIDSNERCATGDFNVIAGTPWWSTVPSPSRRRDRGEYGVGNAY